MSSTSEYAASRRASSTGKRHLPFRIFFLFAAGDAVFLGGLWLYSAYGSSLPATLSAGLWHRSYVLHGAPVLVLAGFLLTALPRWTMQEAVAPTATTVLLLLWLFARGASFIAPDAGLVLASFFIVSLTWIAARRIWATGDIRNRKIVVLLLALFAASVLSAFPSYQPAGSRLTIAALVGFIIVIGGRVVPALTSSFADHAGQAMRLESRPSLERLAAATAATALALWILVPDLPLLGWLCLTAGIAQAARLTQWRGWHFAGTSAILTLHLGYLWLPVGFLLLGADMLLPAMLQQSAAIHAWTIGAFGTLAIGIMSSMIRKHSGQAFSPSLPASVSLAAVTLAALARLAAEVWPAGFVPMVATAAIFWMLAFALFLAAFGRRLLLGPRSAMSA